MPENLFKTSLDSDLIRLDPICHDEKQNPNLVGDPKKIFSEQRDLFVLKKYFYSVKNEDF